MLDPLSRLGDIRSLIDAKQYFVVHAPRQSGKTTTLEALAKRLTEEGAYTALRFSCETGRAFGGNVEKVEDTFLEALTTASRLYLPSELRCPNLDDLPKTNRIKAALGRWAEASPRPLVLFIDEIDAIFDESLLSVLHQLRDGFSDRPHAFPHSIILCGLRDVRDYKVLSGGQQRLGTASPFNIKSDSLRLENFTEAQVAELYLQHTTETGQQFEPEALKKGWELSEGQPWLVNALAHQVTRKMKIPQTQTITALDLEHAAQELIIERQTHLDSLVDKLSEDRVRRVIEPILAGEMVSPDFSYNDAVSYVRDLGLISSKPPIRVANPIYREVIVRVLAAQASDSIDFERRTFVTSDGHLDVLVILSEFIIWWKRHGAFMLRGTYYNEAAAQLVFMAWLQRVVNGGGIIDREYGIGRGRIDVLVRWPLPTSRNSSEWQHEAFELKVWRDERGDPLGEGLEQLERYLDGLGLTHGTLVIFDRRTNTAPIAERSGISEAVTKKGYPVTVVRG
jgi:hypothetical protein